MIDASDTDVVRAFVAALRPLITGSDKHSLEKLDGVWHAFWVCGVSPSGRIPICAVVHYANRQLVNGFSSNEAMIEHVERDERRREQRKEFNQ